MEILLLLGTLFYVYEKYRTSGFNRLNPFSVSSRMRRRMNVNPLYGLEEPREIVTVLLISLIKSTGEITTEQKQILLRTLRRQFELSEEDAGHYFAQASFLMRDTVDILADAEKIIKPLVGKCIPSQIASVEKMMMDVATEEGKATPNTYQQALIEKILRLIDPSTPPKL